MPVQQKIVHVIGKNELFDLDAFFAEAGDEIHRLREVDVAVVVAVDKSTGDFQVLTDVTGEESRASLFRSAGTFFPSQLSVGQSCTPWRSTPAANRSELRPSPSAVK